jgi:transcriptional regulator with XRE-family HTH domain
MRRLREWRTDALMSVRELAAAANVTPKTLTDLEYARRVAGYGTMRRISSVLGVDPREITEFAAAIEKRASRSDTTDGDD